MQYLLKQSLKLQSQLENIKTGKVLRQIQKKVKYVLLSLYQQKELQKQYKETNQNYLLLLDREKISRTKLASLVDTTIKAQLLVQVLVKESILFFHKKISLGC